MAKSKQDYFNQGEADAIAGKPRAALAAGNWQAGYYDRGYDHGKALEIVVEGILASETRKPCQVESGEHAFMAGDFWINEDGSYSEAVDNGDGSLGVLTKGVPKPKDPVIFDPTADVPIPGNRTFERVRVFSGVRFEAPRTDKLADTRAAMKSHIGHLLAEAAKCPNTDRNYRLNAKVNTLINKWRPVLG